MNKAYLITVRSASSRLPEKCFRTLLPGRSLLEYIIQRVKKKVNSDQIVVATTKNSEDDLIEQVALHNSVKVFRGSTNDKISRWIGAAKYVDAEILICCDGDDPLVDIDIGNKCGDLLKENNACIVEAQNLPCGSFTYALKRSSLERIHKKFDTSDSEMMWAFFEKDPSTIMLKHDFKCSNNKTNADRIRITVDYQEDLNMIRKIVKILEDRNLDGSASQIIELVDEFPDIFKENLFRQEQFELNQKEKIKSYNI